jgi:hypothetical protein
VIRVPVRAGGRLPVAEGQGCEGAFHAAIIRGALARPPLQRWSCCKDGAPGNL